MFWRTVAVIRKYCKHPLPEGFVDFSQIEREYVVSLYLDVSEGALILSTSLFEICAEQEYPELENVKEELKKLFKDKHLKTRVHELHFDANRNTHLKIQFSYESNVRFDETTGKTSETEEVKGILITVSSKPRYKDFDDEIKNMIAIVVEVETVLSNASFRLSKELKDVCVELPRGVVGILRDLEATRMSGTIKDSILPFDCFEDKVVVNGIDATATGWLKGIASNYG